MFEAKTMSNSSDFFILDTDCKHPIQTECSRAVWIWKFVPIILLGLGTCCNIFNFKVLSRKRLRAYSTTVYLLFLAGSDLTFLFTLVSTNFFRRNNGFDIKNLSIFNCVVHRWLFYTSAGFSAWLRVFVTLQKTFLTTRPAYPRNNLTRKKSVIISVSCLILLSVSSGHLLFYELRPASQTDLRNGTTQTTDSSFVCVPQADALQSDFFKQWRILIFAVYFILPFITIIIGNILTAANLIRKFIQPLRNLRLYPDGQSEAQIVLDRQLTSEAKMSLFVCLFILVTYIPFITFTVIKRDNFTEVTDEKLYARIQLTQAILQMMLYCNFTFNFWSYFVIGKFFREECDQTFTSLRRRFATFRNRLWNDGDTSSQAESSGSQPPVVLVRFNGSI